MSKLDKHQLVGKLVALLREAELDQFYDFDDAVTQAKNMMVREAKQVELTDLEMLFDSQIATLKDRGVPEPIVEILQNQKGAVVKKASEMTIGGGNIPFLPVIPRLYRSPYDLIAMVRNGSKVGYTCVNPTAISDVVDTPQEPYYIYDVEDGNATLGKSPEAAEKIFKQQKRSPLTAAEAMALTTHTDVLSRHYVWASGSRYGCADRVPDVWLDGGDRPELDWSRVDGSDDRWGSASCGSR